METLDGTEWDVVIAGTGFAQSLLALSLSRSGLKVLHLDQNHYYGGKEAALSLTEAEEWASRYALPDARCPFSQALTDKNGAVASDTRGLASPRAYSLSLAPHLIYAQSNLVPALVSSRAHNQLDFQAVGSWFILDSAATGDNTARLVRVPNGREDVFQDTTFSLQTKRSLMKLLRFVANFEDQPEKWIEDRATSFAEFLTFKFSLPVESLNPILALTLSPHSVEQTTTEFALPRIARHMRSIGTFGPGFAAVLPKWGGLAEVCQVACRACAVGGGVYVLGKGVKSIAAKPVDDRTAVELTDGEQISTKWISGLPEDLPAATLGSAETIVTSVTRAIFIVSSPLKSLFPPTSEGGVMPAGAVVIAPTNDSTESPVHILIHSSEAGECPSNQCVLYASTESCLEIGIPRVEAAVSSLLQNVDGESKANVLWHMQYQQQIPQSLVEGETRKDVIFMRPLSSDIALEDGVLEDVRQIWHQITGGIDDDFMNFDLREGMDDDEDVN